MEAVRADLGDRAATEEGRPDREDPVGTALTEEEVVDRRLQEERYEICQKK